MINKICLLVLLTLVSCGKSTIEIEKAEAEVSGETNHYVGVDFEELRKYCIGKVSYEIKRDELVLNNEEFNYLVDECFYSLDITIPENIGE